MSCFPFSLVAAVVGFVWVGTGIGQEIDAPYPGAAPLVADQEFQLFQALEAAASAGVPAEVAQASFSLSTFLTDSAPGNVAHHLGTRAAETLQTKKPPKNLSICSLTMFISRAKPLLVSPANF